MKKNLRVICFAFVVALAATIIPTNADSVKDIDDCLSCKFDPEEVVLEKKDEKGHIVNVFDDGVEVTYLNEDEIIIRDLEHAYDGYFDLNPRQRSWATIALVIVKTASACSTIQYVSGHDACRIVLKKLGTNAKINNKYKLSGQYVQGKIPGCQPMHSGVCNSGYWEYKVVRV